MLEFAKVGKLLLGAESGLALLLFFLCGVALWAYWRERKRNNAIQEERLTDAREDVRAMTEALVEARSAIGGFKDTLEVVARHLRESKSCPFRSNPPERSEGP